MIDSCYLTSSNHVPKYVYATYHVSVLTYETFYLVYCGRVLSQLLFCQFHLCNHLNSWRLDISHNMQHYSGVRNRFYLSQEIYLLTFYLVATWYLTIVFTLSGTLSTFLSCFFIFDLSFVPCFPAYGKISGKFLQFSWEWLITSCCF